MEVEIDPVKLSKQFQVLVDDMAGLSECGSLITVGRFVYNGLSYQITINVDQFDDYMDGPEEYYLENESVFVEGTQCQ